MIKLMEKLIVNKDWEYRLREQPTGPAEMELYCNQCKEFFIWCAHADAVMKEPLGTESRIEKIIGKEAWTKINFIFGYFAVRYDKAK